jgi:hypothetical protein
MWQMEFTLQVTWWSNAILMTPAHTKAVRPPIREPDQSQPTANGSAREATAQRGKSVLTAARSRSRRTSAA